MKINGDKIEVDLNLADGEQVLDVVVIARVLPSLEAEAEPGATSLHVTCSGGLDLITQVGMVTSAAYRLKGYFVDDH